MPAAPFLTSTADRQRTATAWRLGFGQMLGWGSSYYLPAVLAVPLQKELGIAPSQLFAAFSLALLMAAATGPLAGRCIDRWGGRTVLRLSNGLFALGLALLSQMESALWLFIAWAVIGVAMGSGLYEAAFATVVRLYGESARRSITGIALLGGLASTVGWPLSTFIEGEWGWRTMCLFWAVLHAVGGMLLHWGIPAVRPQAAQTPPAAADETIGLTDLTSPAPTAGSGARWGTALCMAYLFSVAWFVSTAMAAHLPLIFQATGAPLAWAVGAAALVGPAQVAGRLLEFTVLKHAPPLLSCRLAVLAHPLAALVLMMSGASAAPAFAVLHGLGNGILTVAIGTLPLRLFGAVGYGQRQGWLMVPARLVQAASPWVFGLSLQHLGLSALWLTSLLCLSAGAALWGIRIEHPKK